MATTYPTSLQDLDATRGAHGNPLSTPNHITHHLTEDDTIEALQAKVGANSSVVTTSHDYKLSGVTGTDKAVSKTGNETLTNKTLTSPTLTTPKINLGSDATGDIYYRHSDGTLKRLAADEGKILKIVSGVPTYATETVVVDASTTVAGIVEEATLAQIDANTAAGETSARLFVNPSTLGKTIDGTFADNSDAKIPSQKAVKTYVDNTPPTSANGVATRAYNAAAGDQTIAHGLGRTPKKVRITAMHTCHVNMYGDSISIGTYNGTTISCVYYRARISTGNAGGSESSSTYIIYIANDDGTNYQRATIAVDATNITLTWSMNNGVTENNISLMWEAQ